MMILLEVLFILLVLLITSCYAYHIIKSSSLSSLLSTNVNNKINSRTCKKNLCVMNGLGLGGSSNGKKSACSKCGGKGAINCLPCGGKGIDKVNGSVLERWTCKKCKGFGYTACSCTGLKGLTPEQTGER